MADDAPNPRDFGASFKQFMDKMSAAAPKPQPVFRVLLEEHLGCSPLDLPIVSETFQKFEHPNVQRALDAILSRPGCEHTVHGVSMMHKQHSGLHITDLISDSWSGQSAQRGPVEYATIALDEGNVATCIQSGIMLIARGEERLIVVVQDTGRMGRGSILVEVMAKEKVRAEKFLGEIRQAMRERDVYRGHVLSLGIDHESGVHVQFHKLPKIARDNIILPAAILDRVERQTIGFSRHAEELSKAGRHLKRGVLLHGPPGTGKTLTAMYLAGAMQGRTVLLVTGRVQGLIKHVCWMARALQPSIVILEDVDLIAHERDYGAGGCVGPLLFDLLNEMDGLAEDCDIVFLLTTNRPDILEPALAARPGRIDQAIEVPLPDPDCRRRLLELYGEGLDLGRTDLSRMVGRTEGASAAFMRELLRKAAVFLCADGKGVAVEDRHLDEALHELVVAGGALTKSLLGFRAGDQASR
jgi:hypothetical protein